MKRRIVYGRGWKRPAQAMSSWRLALALGSLGIGAIALVWGALASRPARVGQEGASRPEAEPQRFAASPSPEHPPGAGSRTTPLATVSSAAPLAAVCNADLEAALRAAPSSPADEALRKLARRDPGLSLRRHAGTPAPSFVRGTLSEPSADGPRAIAQAFLDEFGALWGIEDRARELAPATGAEPVPNDGGVTAVEYVQVVDAVPVYGHSLAVHVRADGVVRAVTSHFEPGLLDAALPATAAVGTDSVAGIVQEALAVGSAPDLLSSPELVYHVDGAAPRLCWACETVSTEAGTGAIVFIDALTGAVVEVRDTACTVASGGGGLTTSTSYTDVSGTGEDEWNHSFSLSLRKRTTSTYSDGVLIASMYSWYLQDHTRDAVIRSYDMEYGSGLSTSDYTNSITSSDTTFEAWDEKMEANAHRNMGQVLDWFDTVIGRDSFDNSGGDLYLGLHARFRSDTDGDGDVDTVNGNNASSLGNGYFLFGDGGSDTSYTWLDICGHEFTHAVVGDLVSLGSGAQAAALNEHFADMFGVFIEDYWGNAFGESNWLMGEEITGQDADGNWVDNVRNLSNHSVQHYTEYDSSADEHTNCKIPNTAGYLLSEGGTQEDSGLTVDGIGMTAVRRIWWSALRDYLPDSPDFGDLRDAAIAAAQDLYASSGYDRNVEMAFNAVGILDVPIDLVEHGESLAWTSSDGTPSFGSGTTPNSVGYTNVTLEDGSTETGDTDQMAIFPPRESSGYLFGTAYLQVPSTTSAGSGIFEAQVGFAALGTFSRYPTGSSRATVYLTFIPDSGAGPVESVTVARNGALDTITLDLSAYAGDWGTFYVTVMAESVAGGLKEPVIFRSLTIERD